MTETVRRSAPRVGMLAVFAAIALMMSIVFLWPRELRGAPDSVRADDPAVVEDEAAGDVPLVATDTVAASPAGADSERAAIPAAADTATAPATDAESPALAAIEGRVVDPDGLGVAGVRLTLLTRSPDRGAPPPRAIRTDAQGAFRFDDLEFARYDLVHSGGDPFDAFMPRLVPETRSSNERVARVEIEEARAYPLEIRFVPTATLVVRVLDGLGAAMETADVAVDRHGTSVGGTTEADGEWSAPGFEAGTYTVRARVGDTVFVPREIELASGEYRVEAFDLGKASGSLVEGRIVDRGGVPVTGIELGAFAVDGRTWPVDTLFHPCARTAADGSFAIGRLAPGRYSLLLESDERLGRASFATGATGANRLADGFDFEIGRIDRDVGDLVIDWRDGWALTGELVIADAWLDTIGVDRASGFVELTVEAESVPLTATLVARNDATPTTVLHSDATLAPYRCAPWRGDENRFAFSSGLAPSDDDWSAWRPRLVVRVFREPDDAAPFEQVVPLDLERGARTLVNVSLP